ncbi:MAG: ATP-binding cassette domain-containing protein [Streptosporangiales bacterium]|nr:ATP-binding cassette domain-containing protein [Streptosporangiales bacterium]
MTDIRIERLTKVFGALTAVDDLSFTVPSGQVVGFLGPDGAGKTTTLRCLLGLVRPTSGAATIGGTTYAELAEPLREVGATLGATGFHPGRTARDHLRVVASAAGIDEGRVDECLATVELTEVAGRRVGVLSPGTRQRLALATALLGDPGVLVLDEPANGLDPAGIHWLRGHLRRLADDGRTVLVSSNVLAEVELAADAGVIIDRGRLVRQGSMDELTDREAASVRVRTVQADALTAALVGAGAEVERLGPDTLLVHGATSDDVGVVAREAGVALRELAVEDAGLERVFLDVLESTDAEAAP